jgi:hypothetical protein
MARIVASVIGSVVAPRRDRDVGRQLDLAATGKAPGKTATGERAGGAGWRHEQPRRRRPPQLQQFPQRARDGDLRRFAVLRDGIRERSGFDVEAHRQGSHVGHDLRLAGIHGGARRIGCAIALDGDHHADRAHLAVGDDLFAVQGGRVHRGVGGAGFGWHRGFLDKR